MKVLRFEPRVHYFTQRESTTIISILAEGVYEE